MKMQLKIEFKHTTCAACGVAFALTERYESARREDGKGFFCPNGHKLSYGEGETEKLRKKAERMRREAEAARSQAEYEQGRRRVAERQAAAQKGVSTKLRKRASAGVCPCCNRTFQQLSRHMQNKHPEFTESAKAS